MANVKATMTDIRVIIRELSRGTSLREMERKLQLSRTSLRNYRDRAEATGRGMADLLSLNDAELQAIMQKGDGHRGRDADRYAFMHPPLQTPTTSSKKPDTPHANDNTSCRTAHPPQKAAPMPQTSKSIAKSQAKAHEQTQTPQFTRFLSMPLQTDHLQDTCQ